MSKNSTFIFILFWTFFAWAEKDAKNEDLNKCKEEIQQDGDSETKEIFKGPSSFGNIQISCTQKFVFGEFYNSFLEVKSDKVSDSLGKKQILFCKREDTETCPKKAIVNKSEIITISEFPHGGYGGPVILTRCESSYDWDEKEQLFKFKKDTCTSDKQKSQEKYDQLKKQFDSALNDQDIKKMDLLFKKNLAEIKSILYFQIAPLTEIPYLFKRAYLDQAIDALEKNNSKEATKSFHQFRTTAMAMVDNLCTNSDETEAEYCRPQARTPGDDSIYQLEEFSYKLKATSQTKKAISFLVNQLSLETKKDLSAIDHYTLQTDLKWTSGILQSMKAVFSAKEMAALEKKLKNAENDLKNETAQVKE